MKRDMSGAAAVFAAVATLTAAMRYGLGSQVFGVMSNDDAFRDRVLAAADRAGEQAWPMPLPTELRKSRDSRVATSPTTASGWAAAW
jgi:leucyl aminopeptidase